MEANPLSWLVTHWCNFGRGCRSDIRSSLAISGGDDGKESAGIRKMVERSKAAGNVNVKQTEFELADHRARGKSELSTAVLVDWMLGFKRTKIAE
ncbi:MAG: hypothetical protein ACR2NK_10590 [Mariniblastus sp.]